MSGVHVVYSTDMYTYANSVHMFSVLRIGFMQIYVQIYVTSVVILKAVKESNGDEIPYPCGRLENNILKLFCFDMIFRTSTESRRNLMLKRSKEQGSLTLK